MYQIHVLQFFDVFYLFFISFYSIVFNIFTVPQPSPALMGDGEKLGFDRVWSMSHIGVIASQSPDT